MNLIKNFRSFLSDNRQTGSSYEIIQLSIKNDAYIIFYDMMSRNYILKSFPLLKKENAITIADVVFGRMRGRQTGKQIYIDVPSFINSYAKELITETEEVKRKINFI